MRATVSGTHFAPEAVPFPTVKPHHSSRQLTAIHRKSLVVCAFLVLQPAVAGAQPAAQQPGSVEIGTYGQITRVDPSQARFESLAPLSLGIRGTVNLHHHLAAELEASTGVADGITPPFKRRYNQLVARGTYTAPLSDFSGLVLGVGIARSDYEVTYNFGPSVLLGIRTVIRGRYALRSDVIFNRLPTSGAKEFGIRTGLQTVLGPFVGPTTRDRKRGALTMQEPGSIEGSLFLQQWRLNPIWNLQNGQAIGARVGTFITSRSALEVETTYGRQRVAVGGRNGASVGPLVAGQTFRVTTFAFRYAYNLPVGARTALIGAVGPVRSSYEYVDHWGASAVGGARFALTRDLHVRADVSANYLPTERVVDVSARIGLSVLSRLGR